MRCAAAADRSIRRDDHPALRHPGAPPGAGRQTDRAETHLAGRRGSDGRLERDTQADPRGRTPRSGRHARHGRLARRSGRAFRSPAPALRRLKLYPASSSVALAARVGAPGPKLVAGDLVRPVACLMLMVGGVALVAGVSGWWLAARGALTMPAWLATSIPPARQARFIGDWWAHGTSYAAGAL